MCGICGVYHPDPEFQIDSNVIKKMTSLIQYRGPDEDGFYFDKGIALGHRRLSIIDLSGGKQPLSNENGTIWVIFNGEIFNYLELIPDLKSKGHQFKTKSDTEVLVHLYEEYGDNFLQYCNGQFSIALWDAPKKKLILARDRVGIRPLFYSQLQNGSIVFASEIKSLFLHPEIKPTFDIVGLEQLTTLWVTIPPRTIYENIQELRPGSMLIKTPETQTVKQFWKISFPDKKYYEIKSKDYYINTLQELLYDSVKLRLRADVPVGAYLSGGLDSSIITAIIKDIFPNIISTFSVTFDDKNFDEKVFQDQMVTHLNTNHNSISIKYDDIATNFESVIWHTEFPLLRTSPAPLYLLANMVRKNNIKVVLTGEGADEIFGGYNIFKESSIRRFWARYPDSTIRPKLLLQLYPYILQDRNIKSFWELFFKKDLIDTQNPFYSHLLRWRNGSRLKLYYKEEILETFDDEHHIYEPLYRFIDPRIFTWHPLCQAQYLEMTLFMSGYLLSSQGDRMMMAHSVEGRFPFLDYRIIEFASKLPPNLKLNGLQEKYLLKESFKNKLPHQIVKRPKQPYRAPINRCFINSNNRFREKYLTETAINNTGIFDTNRVNSLVNKVNDSNIDVSAMDDMAVALIVSTQILSDKFIKNSLEKRTEVTSVNHD